MQVIFRSDEVAGCSALLNGIADSPTPLDLARTLAGRSALLGLLAPADRMKRFMAF